MSVVDYILVRVKSFSFHKNLKVHDPHLIIDEGRILIDSSIPDHRILTTEVYSEPLSYINKPSLAKNITIKGSLQTSCISARPVQELDELGRQLDLDASAINLDEVYDDICTIIGN